ncbi:MAG: hypothetical protein Q4C95_05675 [Planctomycetia bacterium]|nr:hypothetical protein [Planctomycetia bacterium]
MKNSNLKTEKGKIVFRVFLRPLFFLFIAALLFGLRGTHAASTSDQKTTWIFNNGSDSEQVLINWGTPLKEVGLFTLVPTGTDLTVTLPVPQDGFDAVSHRFFALRCRVESRQKAGGIFFTTDAIPTLSDISYTQFPLSGDDSWQNIVLDMTAAQGEKWSGRVTGIRLDPTNPSDTESRIYLSRAGFFATEEEARSFLDDANDCPDFSLPTVFTAALQRCLVPPDTLKEGYDRRDYCLVETFSAAKMKELADREIKPSQVILTRTDTSGKVIVPFSETNRLGYTVFRADRPGTYSLQVADQDFVIADIKELTADHAEAVRFVVSRQLMPLDVSVPDQSAVDADNVKSTALFHPEAPLVLSEAEAILKTLADSQFPEESLTAVSSILKRHPSPSRLEAAFAIRSAIRSLLGMESSSEMFPPEWFTRDRIRIGAWASIDPVKIGEEGLRRLADCGFDLLIGVPPISNPVERQKFFDRCSRFGMEVYYNDQGQTNPEEAAADYFDSPAFGGHYITDEPGSDDFDKLAKICNDYIEQTGKIPYVNLLPMYANAAQLKYGAGAAEIKYYDADPDLYKKHCDSYCEKFQTHYISTDIYPLNWEGDRKTTYNNYIESINVIARSAREHNKDFWCCIQVFSWDKGKRTPDEEEFRWQSYAMLSFGCKGILAWTYRGYHPDFPSLIDINYRPTKSWYDAAAVFAEIRRLSDTFVQYENLGVFTHGDVLQAPYLQMSNPLTDFSTIRSIDCDDPLLIGCFAKKTDTTTAFTLVNMADLAENRGIDATLEIDGGRDRTVTAWYRGFPRIVKANSDGSYTFRLGRGEGVFVTVE